MPQPPNLVIPTHENDLTSYGHYILTKWESQINSKNSLFAQFYYDLYQKEDVQRTEKVHTYDWELRHAYQYNDQHKITLGLS